MAALDQFAKFTFEEETEVVTNGGAVWCMPPELGLSDVRLDGMIVVRDGARLAALDAPWSQAAEVDEICLEVKMVGDHADVATLERALLRRQARQVQRCEDEKWEGQEPLWMVAPNLPGFLHGRHDLTRVAPGCHRVGPAWFSFLWIAANDLPLREDLIPFLVARSGRALDKFARWVKTRRSREWLAHMVEILPMTTSVREDLTSWIKSTDEPEIRARRRYMAKEFIGADPELKAEVTAEGRDEGRLAEARTYLRRTLARRKLVPTAEDDARIDGCTDIETLRRWEDQAYEASSVAAALR